MSKGKSKGKGKGKRVAPEVDATPKDKDPGVEVDAAAALAGRPRLNVRGAFTRHYDEIHGPYAYLATRVAAETIRIERPDVDVPQPKRGPRRLPETNAALGVAMTLRRHLGVSREMAVGAAIAALADVSGQEISHDNIFDLLKRIERA